MSAPPGGLASRILKPFLKQLSRQARRSPPSSARPTSSSSSKTYEEAKQYAREVWRSTFGQLEREPVYETIPLRRGGREIGGRRWPGQYREYHQSPSSSIRSAPLTQSSRLLAGRIRPTAQLRGPGMVSHTGLHPSPARTFATYGGGKMAHEFYNNVPLGLRALADRIKRQDGGKDRRRKRIVNVKAGKSQIQASLKKYERLHGGNRFALLTGYGQVAASTQADEQEKKRQAAAEEFKRYFELAVQPTVTEIEHAVQETAKDAAREDRNRTTYLLLPLAPSLSHLLSLPVLPSSTSKKGQDPYTAHPTPDLLLSLLPTQQAYDHHARTRLFPLLEKIGGRVSLSSEEGGWLRTDRDGLDVDVEVVYAAGGQGQQEAEALRLVFRGWSEEGVERLVNHCQGKAESESRGWWYIYSVPHSPHRDSMSTSASASFGEADELTDFARSGYASSSSASASSMDLSSLPTSGTLTPLSSSSYASSVYSHTDDIPAPLLTEEEDAWRMQMPVLTETGSVFTPTSDAGSIAGESELDWVEERVWAA